MTFRDEAVALARFVRAPRRGPPRRSVRRGRFRRLLQIGALTIAAALFADLMLAPIATWAGVKNVLSDMDPWRIALGALVWAPLGEELLFRAGLRQADYTLGIGPPLLITLIAPWNRTLLFVLLIWIALAIAVNRALAWRIERRPALRVALGRWFIRRYAGIFWAYTLAFALVHVGNYVGGGARSVVTALLVLPQLLIGISLGYLRLRDGLRSSIALHFLVNAAGIIESLALPD